MFDPGAVLQMVNVLSSAVSTGTTTTPNDDTIPQITEGFEVMTAAVTPKSATSKLKIEVVVNFATSVAGHVTAALFKDATANALAAAPVYVPTSNASLQAVFTHYMTAGSISAATFRVRIGCSNAGTVTFNGQAAARGMGGVMASSVTITEIAA